MQARDDAPDVPAAAAGGEDDDASWLLAGDDPHRLAPAPVVTALPVPGPQPGAVPVQAPQVAAVSDSLPPGASWVAVGAAFQPLPDGPLMSRVGEGPPAAGARMAAEVGTTVHAIREGTVEVVGGDTGAALVLHADEVVLRYGGDVTVSWLVSGGEHVPAGAVLGIVSGAVTSPLPTLVVLVAHTGDVPVDAVTWLAGLPDPGDLGLRPGDVGSGVDPFRLDLRLAGHLDETAADR